MSARRAALLLGLALSGCDAPADRPTREAPTATVAPPPAGGAATTTAGGAATAPSAIPPAGGAALAGTWEGRYEAKKGSVGLPPKVKDKALAADDGKAAAGPGTVELTVAADGELRGKGSGALGACTFTGRVEEGVVRATMIPDDARAPNAMTGIFMGTLKDGVIRGEIKAAGPDATLVREATLELKKK